MASRFHGHAGRANVDDENQRALVCGGGNHDEVGDVSVSDVVRGSVEPPLCRDGIGAQHSRDDGGVAGAP